MAVLLGVTGAIAAGKSLLCRRLVERWGASHLDADRYVHAMYEPGTEAHGRIAAEFGEQVIDESGAIDRKALGALVFGNAERLAALRAAIGDIEGEFMRRLGELRGAPERLAVFEAVRLFEGPYMQICDAGWLVACGEEIALQRLIARNGLTRAEAEQRWASAVDWRERAPKADLILHNNGSTEEFIAAVDDAAAALLQGRP